MSAWNVTMVHGNADVIEFQAPDYDSALEQARAEERARGHDLETHVRDGRYWGHPEDGRVQYGTDYHWVEFVRVKS